MFAPLPIGLALLVVGPAVLPPVRRALLGQGEDKGVAPARTESYFARAYGIEGEVYELTVTADSPLVGMSVLRGRGAARRAAAAGAEERQRGAPGAAGDEMIWVGSVLGVMGRASRSPTSRRTTAAHAGAAAQLRRPVQPQPRRHFRGGDPADLAASSARPLNDCSCASASASACWRSTAATRCSARTSATRRCAPATCWCSTASGATWARPPAAATSWWSPTTRRTSSARTSCGMRCSLRAGHGWRCPAISGAGGADDRRGRHAAAGVLNMDEAYAAVNWKTVFIMACLIPLGWAMDSGAAATGSPARRFERFGGLPTGLLACSA
jgi:hypothetical protein